MSQQMTEKCSHEGCKCPAQAGQKYCSDHCKQCGDKTQAEGGKHSNHECHCHHQQCGHSHH